ncbi:MAG: phosphoenolpyruvate carboxykinase (ATP) [Candidatus Muirbacterium halophilum]|nr:phosphoenolpyruvate carboxykinase (ATP) [Candidatus Muirbacterium halophilum]MCK9475178.1 phosphoenolpyruvate carboxykinase (ATP) [Candidatus Muirbacterium halophilum]
MNLEKKLNEVLDSKKSCILENISRKETIQEVVENMEAAIASCGCLASWTPPESTGRSPKDTYIVKRKENLDIIDWNSSNNVSMEESTFDKIWEDALKMLSEKQKIYITDRVVGADSSYAFPVRTVTPLALTSLFTDNMFRPIPQDIEKSCFNKDGFLLIALGKDKLDNKKYKGLLRDADSETSSDMVVVMDFERKKGIVVGSNYLGSVKKMLFTVMNYLLPSKGILPLHCSANEGKDGKTALFLGLSGTGKTTLSADPDRYLLGDDEHGWSDKGIANFENGCYAKMIDITEEKEPEIYHAVMHNADYTEHGAIVENALLYPNGEFDYSDNRLTENSRASYTLESLPKIKKSSCGSHPETIIFLTADAYGVLPPISKLDKNQAMLWFIMGYTSKLAGTERGVTEPSATFSRFFGQPFMPLNPSIYANMLGDNMEKHKAKVYLVNTGWSGGPYGIGKRIKLKYTRKMIDTALSGELDNIEFKEDKLFHVNIPITCEGVPTEILFPQNTWKDKKAYTEKAKKLAEEFSAYFDKVYKDKNISSDIKGSCPGK